MVLLLRLQQFYCCQQNECKGVIRMEAELIRDIVNGFHSSCI